MWQTFSTALNVILGLFAIYLYLENRKLKGFEIDKDIVLKEIELRGSERKGPGTAATYNYNGENYLKCLDKINAINAELNHLKRLKKYRWIFSK